MPAEICAVVVKSVEECYEFMLAYAAQRIVASETEQPKSRHSDREVLQPCCGRSLGTCRRLM